MAGSAVPQPRIRAAFEPRDLTLAQAWPGD